MKIKLLRQNQTVIVEQDRDKKTGKIKRKRHYDNTYLTTLQTDTTSDKSAEWLADYVVRVILQQDDYHNLTLVCDDVSGYWTIKFTVMEFVSPDLVELEVDTDDINRYITA